MSLDGTVIIIDDHDSVRNALRAMLESYAFRVKDYATAGDFLREEKPDAQSCLLVDIRMPGMSGLELHAELVRRDLRFPLIVMTGHADVALAVKAMKGGAHDFLEKPFDDETLVASIRQAFQSKAHTQSPSAEARDAAAKIALLTEREREILDHLVQGESNKAVAHHLGISPRTVEVHRAHVQEKLRARGLSDLVRIARMAGQQPS